MFEVFADQSNNGWRGEVVLVIGPLKRIVYTEDGFADAPTAESTVAQRVMEAMAILLAGEEAAEFDKEDEG
jgi:hypothetical protein